LAESICLGVGLSFGHDFVHSIKLCACNYAVYYEHVNISCQVFIVDVPCIRGYIAIAGPSCSSVQLAIRIIYGIIARTYTA
jgi:hypothetical protein